MTAIQNLNSYMDTLQSIASGTAKQQQHQHAKNIVEIDFVMHLNTGTLKRGGPKTSRRKVELLLPPSPLVRELASKTPHHSTSLRRLDEHSKQEIVKLLRVAGLKIPNDVAAESFEDAWSRELGLSDEDYQSDSTLYSSDQQSGSNTGFRRAHAFRRPKTAYEKNRDRFMSKIQWQNYDRIYKEAVREMHADHATEGLIKHHAGRRRAMIANILSRIRIQPHPDGEPISFVEQLVAFRRLSLLLEDNFEKLQMEDFGHMWESCRVVLTPARDYNASGTALHKRRRKGAATGYSFTLHPDTSVTIHIPIDFQDVELIEELDQNVWDFYDFVSDELEELFPQQPLTNV